MYDDTIKFVEYTLGEIQKKLEDLRLKRIELEQLKQITQEIEQRKAEAGQLKSNIDNARAELEQLNEQISAKQAELS